MHAEFRNKALMLVPCAAALAAVVHLWQPEDRAPQGSAGRSEDARQAYLDCQARARPADSGDRARALQHRQDPGSVSQAPLWLRQSQAAIEHCLQASPAASWAVRTAAAPQ
jgi:hypothetical protein